MSERPLVTDLVQIKRLGELKRDENLRLRLHMKRHAIVERRLKIISDDIEKKTECLSCANCCRSATARLQEREIESVAKGAGMRVNDFMEECVEESADEGMILRRNEDGSCVFLHGNECLIYRHRPTACRHFPHLTSGPGSLAWRRWEMPDRATYCPIVYNTLEAWKDETDFQRTV